jgi:hypothetical protein
MKRTIFTTLAATALLTIPACKGGASASGGKLIPEQATIMVGVDVAGLMKSKLYVDNKAKLESQAGYKEMAEAAKACNLDPEKAVSSVLLGTDAKDGFAVVFTGDGIGDEKNLTCVADKAKEKNNGKVPFTIADEGGKKTLKMDDGTGYIIDARTVVIASKPWAAAVKDLVDGKGKAAVDGANKDIFSRADQSKHVWFAGVAPEQVAGMAKAGPVPVDVKDFSGSLDLSSGLGLKFAAGLGNDQQAADLKKKADEQLPMAKMGLALIGLPATVADTVKIDAKGNVISLEMSMSDADLKTAQEKLGALAGGGGGFPMGGGGGDAMPPAEPAAPPTPPPAEGTPPPAAPAP